MKVIYHDGSFEIVCNQETYAALKETGCIDSLGRLRAVRPEAKELLAELGHSSLDFDKCKCSDSSLIGL